MHTKQSTLSSAKHTTCPQLNNPQGALSRLRASHKLQPCVLQRPTHTKPAASCTRHNNQNLNFALRCCQHTTYPAPKQQPKVTAGRPCGPMWGPTMWAHGPMWRPTSHQQAGAAGCMRSTAHTSNSNRSQCRTHTSLPAQCTTVLAACTPCKCSQLQHARLTSNTHSRNTNSANTWTQRQRLAQAAQPCNSSHVPPIGPVVPAIHTQPVLCNL